MVTMGLRKWVHSIDFVLILIVAAILIIGLFILCSATVASVGAAQDRPYLYVKKQGVWMLAGLAVMVGMCSFDYQILGQYHRLIYVGTLLVLALVLVLGKDIAGTRVVSYWHGRIQPAELAKIRL